MEDHDNEVRPGSIAIVLGTRPEIIKLGYVIKGLGPAVTLIHTGQHFAFALSASFLEVFGIEEPSHFLGVGGQTRASQIGSATTALGALFEKIRPNAVVVQGDTNSTLAGALAANAHTVPLAHVEAGLRSRDRRMPEEHNRVLTDHLADRLYAPTDIASDNLLAEGIGADRVMVTGNTVVEAVQGLMPDRVERLELLDDLGLVSGDFVLSTFHRPENVDDPDRFALILKQLGEIPHEVVLPLHPRSRLQAERFGLDLDAIRVIEPLGYREFLGLGSESALLVSDSGGVQEEVSVYKRPVVVVRRSTERPEVLGTFARLVEPEGITEAMMDWLADIPGTHSALADIPTPFGDGTASAKIVGSIRELATGV